jgi:heptosyltransferase-2
VSEQRLLVVGPSWIGDMVMAQSLFQRLRQHRPDRPIDVVAPTWSRAILSRMPEVDRTVELRVRHGELRLRERLEVGRSLRDRDYEQAIVLPRSFKAALIPFFARVPRRTGYKGEARYGLINDMRPLDRAACPRTVQRFVALGEAPGTALPPPVPPPRLRVDRRGRERVLKRLGLAGPTPSIALVPGAQYGPSRRWPAARFGELAARLVARGYRVWILGSTADRDSARTILAHCPGNVIDLTGRTSIEEAIDLLSLPETVVSNDTGLMHIAGAVGTRVVALYGATSPEQTPPLGEKQELLYRGVECSPCTARVCPFGHQRCLTEIEPDEVLQAVLGPPARRAAGAAHILE